MTYGRECLGLSCAVACANQASRHPNSDAGADSAQMSLFLFEFCDHRTPAGQRTQLSAHSCLNERMTSTELKAWPLYELARAGCGHVGGGKGERLEFVGPRRPPGVASFSQLTNTLTHTRVWGRKFNNFGTLFSLLPVLASFTLSAHLSVSRVRRTGCVRSIEDHPWPAPPSAQVWEETRASGLSQQSSFQAPNKRIRQITP